MQTKLFSLFVIISCFTFSANGQGLDCNKKTVALNKDEVKIQTEYLIRKLKLYGASFTDDSLKLYKIDYEAIRGKLNSIYSKVRDDIASGFTFVGEGAICRRYGDQFVAAINEANGFNKRLANDLARKGLIVKSSAISFSAQSPGWIGWIIQMVGITLQLDKEAREKAELFYKDNAWQSFDDIK
jgi:hypothetical protein